MKKNGSYEAAANDPVLELYRRPGFMLRRAHQIAVSVFVEETAELGVTTTQFGILHILRHRPHIDQATVARLLGLDRSTTGMVVKTLAEAGLIARVVEKTDNRKRSIGLTAAGERLLKRLDAPAKRQVRRLLSPLTVGERATFLNLLEKMTLALNPSSRVPLVSGPSEEKPANPRPRALKAKRSSAA